MGRRLRQGCCVEVMGVTHVRQPAGRSGGGGDPRHELGREGEDLASDYLRAQGLVIVERNWRCRDGEIDVVALDEESDTLVIVEVKTRRSSAFGSPLEAVTAAKAGRLRRLASRWLIEHPIGVSRVRIDVIGVLAPRRARAHITHVRDVTA